jgi:phosphoribosylaminoimidazole carboxylase
VAINNATNAGLLAARILGVLDSDYLARTEAYTRTMEAEVMKKRDTLSKGGYVEYSGPK